ncbi:hypothetical protein RN607_14550 [Demequina capsici]|uniref:Uncharacterized protein n=1 Tax=Demequina capsici TaxID=3075620 RepID=A0AA96FBU7_9MICO|nr:MULTISPECIES: hypothetical protein [unclassified Demequina]WNM24548.1 hypothetical protein RN606_14495 [Demequina sp. OYTSA14]WNM27399.1 hypothetical protein RN607_14550 [Demequina sp. PMTSA13]
MTTVDVDWNAAWERTLTELEIDVAQAEALLTASHRDVALRATPWTPPELPPLPASMLERARTLLDRQLKVSQQLADAARESRRHSRAVAHLKVGTPPVPVYIDAPA